jgi:hypothetical protein
MTTSGFMMRAKLAGMVAAGLLGTTCAADATNFDISSVGFIGDTTSLSGTINGNPFNESANTGLITLTTTTGSILPVFCIDLFHTIKARRFPTPQGRSSQTRLQTRPARAANRSTRRCRAKSRP